MKIASLFLVITKICHQEYCPDLFKITYKDSSPIYIQSKEDLFAGYSYKKHEVLFKIWILEIISEALPNTCPPFQKSLKQKKLPNKNNFIRN